MSLSQSSLVVGFLLTVLALSACPPASPGTARADEKAEVRAREIRDLVEFLNSQGFYGLREPKAKDAIAGLHGVSEQASPAVAEMLAVGLKNRKAGWIEVYRPLFIMNGMGVHAKAALADITKALDDEHSINVQAAAVVLKGIGPPAKDALPGLQREWESPDHSPSTKEAIASAIKSIDPKTAKRNEFK